ncbi:hypothetical protein D3C87_1902610 [compost metagenome]
MSAGMDNLGHFLVILAEVRGSQQIGHGNDAIQRCADFVAHHRQKAAFDAQSHLGSILQLSQNPVGCLQLL